jgi:long-chain fatty acid transport protein
LSNGRLEANLTAIGLGKVRYRDAKIEGLSQPREIGIGVALRPARSLLVALELNWMDWSSALKSATLTASNPDHPAAPPLLRNQSTLDWRDQYVFAIGAAYELDTQSVIRAGYNYGRNPIPGSTTNPLLAAISEQSVTLGYGRRLSRLWEVSTGVEYSLPNKVTYTNPELPFGLNAQERNEFVVFHLMLSRRW